MSIEDGNVGGGNPTAQSEPPLSTPEEVAAAVLPGERPPELEPTERWGGDGAPRKASLEILGGREDTADAWVDTPFPEVAKALEIPAMVGESAVKVKVSFIESSFDAAKRGDRPRQIHVETTAAGGSGDFSKRLAESVRPIRRDGFLRKALSVVTQGKIETDSFALGLDGVAQIFDGNPEREFLQTLGGPFSRQLYLSAKLDAYAKQFWELHHQPLFHRACVALSEYVVGRGVKFRAEDPKMQAEWDEWEERDRFYWRLWMACYGLTWQGEVLWRGEVSDLGPSLGLRLSVSELDGSTIWEKITDPENYERVHGYWQQYPTPYQIYTMIVRGQPVPFQKYIIRTIPADEVIHVLINETYGEKFGRSDGFSSLSWSKRIRETAAAFMISAQVRDSFVWDLLIRGEAGDVSTALQSDAVKKMPKPGSILAHNDMVEWKPLFGAAGSTGQSGTLLDAVRLFCAGIGVPIEYVGFVDDGGTKALAISRTAPWAKHVEMRQLWLETQLLKPFLKKLHRTAVLAGRMAEGSSWKGEFTWPEPAPEDTDAKIGRLQDATRTGVIPHKDYATAFAGELRITNYDYELKQREIQAEKQTRELSADDALANAAAGAAARRSALDPKARADNKQTDSTLDPAK